MPEQPSFRFNQQQGFSDSVEVALDWAKGVTYEGEFNSFHPEVLERLNLKKVTLYELLSNSTPGPLEEKAEYHSIELPDEWSVEMNVVEEEYPDPAQLLPLLMK